MQDKFITKYTINQQNGCWEWTKNLNPKGYGKFCVQKGKEVLAHRMSYKLFKGDFDNNLCVCHRCDNPKCVNPEHLFLGTRSDNNKDRNQKGREGNRKGVINGRSKLTDELVSWIRESSQSCRDIAYFLGMGRSPITRIKSYKAWTHIEGAPIPAP